MKRILTKSETKLMNVLWSLPNGRGHGTEIVRAYGEPKPALTTVLTFLKILERKGFVTSRREGRSHVFIPTLDREQYKESYIENMRDVLFDGSTQGIARFLLQHGYVSADDLRQIAEQG